jgi:hypothetical protein
MNDIKVILNVKYEITISFFHFILFLLTIKKKK